MKKQEMINKLAALGVKVQKPISVPELRKALQAAQHDTSKPGAYIGKIDITSAIGAKQPK